MKKTMMLFALVGLTTLTYAQKKKTAKTAKTTTSATISFDATTKIDALPKADNKTVVASINPKTGEVAFESIMKSFTFTNPMIQDHFNSAKWLDSEKYPKATFKGKITNLTEVNFAKDGTYSATVTGDLTLHGATKPVSTTATIVVNGKELKTTTDFTIKLADFGVDGPAIAGGKVATDPKITVAATFK
jgi:polyisoprenoid-binding protein YceI